MSLSAAPLSLRFLHIHGIDAIKFLQGQCSCDLEQLTPNNYLYGTLNTPKGRIYCFFKAVLTENGLLLGMESSLFEASIAKLKKYAVFFKCTLEELTDYSAWGLVTSEDSNDDHLFAATSPYSCTKNDAIFILSIAQSPKLTQVWVKGTQLPDAFSIKETISSEHWLAMESLAGIPAIYDVSLEEFILQNLNLQQLNTVSFKKGCYTGQEIIARMKFLGKLKKKTFLMRAQSEIVIRPLMSLEDQDGQKCGTLVRGHWSPETGLVALGIFNIEDATNIGDVFVESDRTTPFKISEIDYQQFSV